MATLKEYFNKDFENSLILNNTFLLQNTADKLEIEVKVGIEVYSGSTFIAFYVPVCAEVLGCIAFIIENIFDEFLRKFSDIQVNSGFIGDIKLGSFGSQFSTFSRKIYLYLENDLNDPQLNNLSKMIENRNFCVTVRSNMYLRKKMELEKPLAFISHDSLDKKNVAESIAIGLQKLLCPVWYDEYSLKVGDNLRESIEKGIKETKKCILILSKNFLNNTGWTKTEFNSIFTRELLERSSVILPVWVGIGQKEIYEYCPSLVNRVALKWTSDLKDQNDIIQKLYREIT